MRTRIIESISAIQPENWNALLADDNPFLRHEFLDSAEITGCASAQSGWLPCHIVCETEAAGLIGAVPLYLKNNSQGEFVFDFSWASAYHQAGLAYYPKLVCAVPFTPASGQRLLIKPGLDKAASDQVKQLLLETAMQLAEENNASSIHILFPTKDEINFLKQHDFMLRKDCQFHWRNNNYQDFDEFLATFTSSKRKKTRRERRRINEAGIHFEVRKGDEIDSILWEQIIELYSMTFLRRGRPPYFNREFFEMVARKMPDNMVVFLGYAENNLIATAICFRSKDVLYGRYWGANGFVDSLHFETCYYQGIDYCIRENIAAFEPGTQGEHKVSRGFIPTETWSAHWLSHPQFAVAVDDYLQREREHIDQYIDSVNDHIPYRSQQDT